MSRRQVDTQQSVWLRMEASYKERSTTKWPAESVLKTLGLTPCLKRKSNAWRQNKRAEIYYQTAEVKNQTCRTEVKQQADTPKSKHTRWNQTLNLPKSRTEIKYQTSKLKQTHRSQKVKTITPKSKHVLKSNIIKHQSQSKHTKAKHTKAENSKQTHQSQNKSTENMEQVKSGTMWAIGA